MSDIETLEKNLLLPSDKLLKDISAIEGDILILGVGGKMGPGIAKLSKQAIDKTNKKKKITGVSRFSDKGLQKTLEQYGIETISADLLDEESLKNLPDVPNVIYLAGHKFGSTGNEPFTWAMNAYLPGRVAEKYKHSNIVAFSTGNVYPFTEISSGGLSEEYSPSPVGEYGQSCLGRERLFQYFSEKTHTSFNIPAELRD